MSSIPDIAIPTAHDAEQAIICSALINPGHVQKIAETQGLTATHFFFAPHVLLWETIEEFWRDNEPIELTTLTTVLRDRKTLSHCAGRVNGQPCSGASFITELQTLLPTAMNAEAYAEIILAKYRRRKGIESLQAAIGTGYDTSEEEDVFFAAAEDALLKIGKLKEGQRIHNRTMKELIIRASDRIQAALDSDGSIDMPTGIPALDHYLQGFRAPEVTVIAAKPSDGKTAWCLNCAEHLAIKRKKRVGIISLEMSDDQLTDRLLASHAGVNTREIKRKREITHEDINKLTEAAKRIAEAPIYIRDDGQLSMPEIGATLTAWKAKHGLDIAFIDHAQLVRGDGKTSGRTEEVEQVSRALKPLAKRLEIPIVILSQVSEDSNGQYSTKNSRALSEDCDNLLSISHTKEGSWIRISKQRDGERNISVPVTFIPHLMRFTGKAPEDEEPQPDLLDDPRKGRKYR